MFLHFRKTITKTAYLLQDQDQGWTLQDKTELAKLLYFRIEFKGIPSRCLYVLVGIALIVLVTEMSNCKMTMQMTNLVRLHLGTPLPLYMK